MRQACEASYRVFAVNLRRRMRWMMDKVFLHLPITGLRRMRRGFTVLTYHRVLPERRCRDVVLRSLVVPEAVFRDQIAWLKRHCDILPIREAFSRGTAGGRPIVCLTFDDGYDDNFAAAAILEEAGVRATFFVTVDLIDGKSLWYDVASVGWKLLGKDRIRDLTGTLIPDHVGDVSAWMAFLKQSEHRYRTELVDGLRPYVDPGEDCRGMSAQQLRSLHDAGHEIGCHTIGHPRLEQSSDSELATEIGVARQRIMEILGQSVEGFCYPDGSFNDRVVQEVERAGYRYACTTMSGRNADFGDPFRIRRFDVTSRGTTLDDRCHDATMFEAEISGLHRILRRRSIIDGVSAMLLPVKRSR